MGQHSKVASGDQILQLEPDSRRCSSCLEYVEKQIVSGLRTPQGGSSTTTLALCNVCLSWLRELIAEHETTPTAVRKVPKICTACGHALDSHTPGTMGRAHCTACGTCPGYAGPT